MSHNVFYCHGCSFTTGNIYKIIQHRTKYKCLKKNITTYKKIISIISGSRNKCNYYNCNFSGRGIVKHRIQIHNNAKKIHFCHMCNYSATTFMRLINHINLHAVDAIVVKKNVLEAIPITQNHDNSITVNNINANNTVSCVLKPLILFGHTVYI